MDGWRGIAERNLREIGVPQALSFTNERIVFTLTPKGILPAFLASECPHVADRRPRFRPNCSLRAYIFRSTPIPPPAIFRSLSPPSPLFQSNSLHHFHAPDSPDFEPASSRGLISCLARGVIASKPMMVKK